MPSSRTVEGGVEPPHFKTIFNRARARCLPRKQASACCAASGSAKFRTVVSDFCFRGAAASGSELGSTEFAAARPTQLRVRRAAFLKAVSHTALAIARLTGCTIIRAR